MLIAEDSEIASLYEGMFEDEFDVVVAQTGQAAFALADKHDHFDIAIVDIIMPVETPTLDLAAADRTGVRFIQRLLDTQKCSRLLIITVVWDINDELKALIGTRAHYVILNKGRIEPEEIEAAVKTLMAKPEGQA